jgi:hypothetical protein
MKVDLLDLYMETRTESMLTVHGTRDEPPEYENFCNECRSIHDEHNKFCTTKIIWEWVEEYI